MWSSKQSSQTQGFESSTTENSTTDSNENKTPEDVGVKGDHFVGDYYVKFNDKYKAQIATLEQDGMSKEEAEKKAPIMLAAQEMLRKWEAGDAETMALWKKMNDWVYEGFDQTYTNLGVDFDRFYYESDTYLLGKALVQVFYKV